MAGAENRGELWRIANTLPTKAAQIRVALRHHERNFATWSATRYRSKHITQYHQSSRSPATRHVYTSMFRAPQWHGATQTHSPPRPRKSARRLRHNERNIATRSAHTLAANISHDTTIHPAHQRHAAFTVYTSMFRPPQWHGATLTHLPPRPRKSTWHCDITVTLGLACERVLFAGAGIAKLLGRAA